MNIVTNPATTLNLTTRINNLHINSERKWGSMNVNEMLLHCIDGLRMIFGELQVKDMSNWLMRTFGKPFVLSGINFPKNSPTAPELVKSAGNFTAAELEANKQTLLAYIDKLKNASDSELKPHAMFGKFSKQQYGKFVYKHLDHHLRQFGV